MKITIVNHSDTLGGASVVSYRLMKALREAGHDARMLVIHKATDDPDVVVAGPQWRAKACFLAEHLRIFAACRFDRRNLFKISIATDGLPLASHPLIRQADAVLLNWINQGMLSLGGIEAIAARKPVLWTMHDMWNLTSVCHHSGECSQYIDQEGCRNCPLTPSKHLVQSTWKRKQALYSAVNIQFVAVSSWLERLCRKSTLMKNQRVSTIHNAFPIDKFYIAPKKNVFLGLPDDKKIIIMGAARLDDPIKGLPYAIEALNKLNRDDAVAVFYGALRDEHALDDLRFPHIHIGKVAVEDIPELYTHANIVLSSSLFETLPGTLIEGQAAGCTPISFDSGGQADIIRSNEDGILVKPYDTEAFARAIDDALDNPRSRTQLHARVEERFGAKHVAEKYIKLIGECIALGSFK